MKETGVQLRVTLSLRVLGFFLLALLIVESFLACTLIGGNLTLQQKTLCMFAGLGVFVLVTSATATALWHSAYLWFQDNVQSHSRLEILMDIPADSLETICEDFKSEGAKVSASAQEDGQYTVFALFH